MNDGVREIEIVRVTDEGRADAQDRIAVEEPLEIRVGTAGAGRTAHRAVSITMRTPGQDEELAVGFLFTEGILRHRSEILRVQPCGRPAPPHGLVNTVRVDLAPGVSIDWARLERNFYTTSSCGVCGKTSLEALAAQTAFPIPPGPIIAPAVLPRLPDALRAAQGVFDQTGGLHASAIFTPGGDLLAVREDVGRHNALDKLIGFCLLEDRLPLSESILLVSGRVSFELAQKARMAGIPILAAVGAPSSLAVDLCRDAGITLIGFLRGGRFNIYAGEERVGK